MSNFSVRRDGLGGRGGDATVAGDDSSAEGGCGGDAVVGDGGDGGHATVAADRSHAIGGRGGRGGIGPGGRGGNAHVLAADAGSQEQIDLNQLNSPIGPGDTYISINGEIILLARAGSNGDEGGRGGDAFAIGDDSFVAGGQGAESFQAGGRGGRGGRAFMPEDLEHLFETRRYAHMRWPYYEPVTEPGRGGDAPDTPQYKARRLIVEAIKMRHFANIGLPLTEVWWDRDVVPLNLINKQLEVEGHNWRATVVDDEYEFSDIK